VQSKTGPTYNKLDSLRWFSQRRSSTPHFGGAHSGGYDPQSRTQSRFLYNAPTPCFVILCLLVRKLSCWPTNKQTNINRLNCTQFRQH